MARSFFHDWMDEYRDATGASYREALDAYQDVFLSDDEVEYFDEDEYFEYDDVAEWEVTTTYTEA